MKILNKLILISIVFMLFSTSAFGQGRLGRFGAGGSAAVSETSTNYTITKDTVTIAGHLSVTTVSFTTFTGSNVITDSIKVNNGSSFGYDGGNNSYFFQNAETGENPFVYIYGYSTTHAGRKYGRINVSAQGNLIIWGEVAGYLGAQGQSTYLFDNQGGAFLDDKRLRFGSDNDVILAYDETTIDGMLFGVPVTSKRGLAFIDAADISVDITSLIGTTNFPDVHYIDTDSDSKLKIGWIADDEPEITANQTLDIQSSGDFDLNIFGKSGAGENAVLKIWGDESGTPTFFSVAVEASGNTDINAEGNIEFGGQGTQIGQWTNKIQQMLDQRWISLGTASQGDFRMVWDDSAHASGYNEAVLMGLGYNRGIIIGDAALLTGNGGNAYDLKTLLPDRFPQSSLMMIDDDRDSYLQFYHSGDDLPTIKSTNLIIVDAPSLALAGEATNLYLDYGSVGAEDHDVIINFGDDGSNNAHTFKHDDGLDIFLASQSIGVPDNEYMRNATNDAYVRFRGSGRLELFGSASVRIASPLIYTPNAASNSGTSVADDAAITVVNTIMRMVGADADAVLDTDPAVNDGSADGQIVIIQGTADGNLVTIADNVNTQLAGGLSMTLGDGDVLALMWDSNYSMWIELYRSDN